MSTNTFVPAGAPLHASAGDVPAPAHVYVAGIVPLFANASLVRVSFERTGVDAAAGVEDAAAGAYV
jgi:hypothetical protein